jgi:hypothetical protein
VASDPICQLARNTAVPAAKRTRAADECNQLLSRAGEPVTKPVLPEPLLSATRSAEPAASPCSQRDLGARYVGGGDGGQTFMGGIVIWNSGRQPCRVDGDVDISATGIDGAPDTGVVLNRPIRAVDAYLPANIPAYRDTTPLDRYLRAQLAAPQFNATDTCTEFSGPASFVLSIGPFSFHVENHDPDATQNVVLRGCQGRILLDNVDEPSPN